HGSARFSEYVQTVSPNLEDTLAPDSVLTKFKIVCAVSLIPRQHDCWNASSRYAPIVIAQRATQSAAIFVLSTIKCLDLASPYRECLFNAALPSTCSRHKAHVMPSAE